MHICQSENVFDRFGAKESASVGPEASYRQAEWKLKLEVAMS